MAIVVIFASGVDENPDKKPFMRVYLSVGSENVNIVLVNGFKRCARF